MPKLVFDIETSGLPVESFDAVQQEYLFREVENLTTEEEKAERRCEIIRLLNLWPLTARVVCIAMVNVESARGRVLFTADDCDDESQDAAPVQFIPCVDEAELLTQFWDSVKKFDTVITFNGRGFDVPFLYLRSALLNVPISRKDWMGNRYNIDTHCDLADQLTFFGGTRDGAARRFNLDFYCKAFGIPSPKSQGVTGMDVNNLIAQGQYREIAEYCLRDVQATIQLYRIWQERLAGCGQNLRSW